MADRAPIPEEPEGLTAPWLGDALAMPVAAVEREVLGQGQGFLGDIVRLRIRADCPEGPRSVIVKMPKRANRAVGEMLGVYEREVLFFRELADGCPVRIPAVYFSHYDPDAGSARQKEILGWLDRLPRALTPLIGYLGMKVAAAKNRRYLLIMEDLGGFEAGDQFAGASVDACSRVLEQFAPAHARYWNAPELEQHFWLLPFDIDARMREGMFRKTLKQYLEQADSGLRPQVAWLADHYAELVRALAREAPVTLVHNDLRLDNVCFDGHRCAYLDWQLVRSGPAAYDVGYFLGGALDVSVTADEEDAILERYHQALGRPDYPFDRFLRDYRRALVLSLAAVAPNADVTIDAGRGQTMMARWRERLARRLERVDVATLI